MEVLVLKGLFRCRRISTSGERLATKVDRAVVIGDEEDVRRGLYREHIGLLLTTYLLAAVGIHQLIHSSDVLGQCKSENSVGG